MSHAPAPADERRMDARLGVCQWFHYEAYDDVERAVEALDDLGVRHLRTGISWADYHRPGGRAWYDWLLSRLADYELLVSIWHTPPSIAENGRCNGPPRRLQDYADFVWCVLDRYGDRVAHLELWNEPNNWMKWDFRECDPQWRKFAGMIAMAANTAHGCGASTVLGGMIPVDHHWLGLMERAGALEDVDVVAIHAFPGMWWYGEICWEWESHWRGWDAKVDYIAAHTGGRAVWCTETGLATWDRDAQRPGRHDAQVRRLRAAAAAPLPRIYWYSLIDLDPRREAIEGFHVDENEYHMGLIDHLGQRKPAYQTFKRLLRGGVPDADVSTLIRE